jgi:hypothetical protein
MSNSQDKAITKLFEDVQESREGATTDAVSNYRELYVGEGKKYANEEEAFKGLHHAQEYIKRLEEEQRGLRSELDTRLSVEQFVDKLAAQTRNDVTSNSTVQGSNESNQDMSGKGVSITEIETLINKKLTEIQTKQIQEHNVNFVASELKKAWGNSYGSKLKAKAAELEMSEYKIIELASSNPKALLKLVTAGEQKHGEDLRNVLAPTTSVNSSAQNSNSNGIKGKKYYDKVRKEDPRRYWSPSFQKEVHEAAQKLGDAFYSN